MKTNPVLIFLFLNINFDFEDIDWGIRLKQRVASHTIDLFFTTHIINFFSLASLGIPQVIQFKHNFFVKIKNSPIKGWGGLSKMSKKMSIIELSRIGQDLFDFSDLTWGHPLTHSSTHRYLQTKSNYINKFKLYYISHLTWPHPLTHPLIHTPIHRYGCLNKS